MSRRAPQEAAQPPAHGPATNTATDTATHTTTHTPPGTASHTAPSTPAPQTSRGPAAIAAPDSAPPVSPHPALELMLITGMSGSGKSVVIHALEDAGYYCVDNLPPELLQPLAQHVAESGYTRLAVAMDVRSAASLERVPQRLAALRAQGVRVKSLFLDAGTDTLVRRFSETRRRHPLSSHDSDASTQSLIESIEHERELLAELRENADVIDTSLTRASQLIGYVKAVADLPASQMTLVFESFAFKRGIPLDADYVFDVRMLPNPHYDADLRPLTGRDAPVARYLDLQPPVQKMRQDIQDFLTHWLPALVHDHRHYVTVAIGCTGGQHRSVYLVEQLAAHFSTHWATLKRHRELDGLTTAIPRA